MNNIQLAVEKAGSLKGLATACGVLYQNIQNWRKVGYPPAKYVLAIEKATGISRHDLRPDLYPRDNLYENNDLA